MLLKWFEIWIIFSGERFELHHFVLSLNTRLSQKMCNQNSIFLVLELTILSLRVHQCHMPGIQRAISAHEMHAIIRRPVL